MKVESLKDIIEYEKNERHKINSEIRPRIEKEMGLPKIVAEGGDSFSYNSKGEPQTKKVEGRDYSRTIEGSELDRKDKILNSKIKPYWDNLERTLNEMYNERLNQIRKGNFNDNLLEKANKTLSDKTKISEKDKANLTFALEYASYFSDGIDVYPEKASPEIYLFGSSVWNSLYRDIDLIIPHEGSIKNIKQMTNYNNENEFKTTREEHGGGYDGFLLHGEYKLSMPEGDWIRGGKTKIHIVYPKNPLNKIPLRFNKVKLMGDN